MDSWMVTLARHFNRLYNEEARRNELVVLFDIDGTILDHRHIIYDVLNRYDEAHGTQFFRNLDESDIRVRENSVRNLLERLGIPEDRHPEIVSFYREHRWSEETILRSHQPFQGVMDVIRWFQLQPETHVGLNTARPERLRQTTLRSLNRLTEEYKVKFTDDMLHMNDQDWDHAERSKVEGIRYFKDRGYRVVAMIDNEPENLEAIDESDEAENILLLHADKLLNSRSDDLPDDSVSGEDFRVSELIQGQTDLEHVTFVQDGLTDRKSLNDFLNSSVHWGNLTIREHPDAGDLILRQESFKRNPYTPGEDLLSLADGLDVLESSQKGSLLDLHLDPYHLENLIDRLSERELENNDLGFRTELGPLQPSDIKTLRTSFPESRLQIPVNFLSDVILGEDTKSGMLLQWIWDELEVDEFSVDWQVFRKRDLLKQLQSWNFPVNLRNVPNLEQFLKAALLLPDSITVNLDRQSPRSTDTPNYRDLSRSNF